jgi:hypothetical protein
MNKVAAGRLSIWVITTVLGLAGCAEQPMDVADAPFQACVERGYQLTGLSYAATTVYQPTAIDRFWPRTVGRSDWRSPVEQCKELRARGQLAPD